MTDSNLDTMENGWEKAQIVEFKELYPELAEVEDISQLQDKLNIPNSDTIIPIFSRLSLYKPGDNKYIAKGLKSKIEDLFPTIAKKYGNNDNHDIYLYYCRGFPIFNIKQCFSNQSDYIFITETWYVFAAQKEDFDKNWVLSESLNLLGKPEPDENIHRNIQCSEYNWEIKYTYGWAFKWTLPWSCFKYIDTPDDENRILYVWCKSCIYKSTIGWSYEKHDIYEERTDAIDLELWEIKKINLDPKKNLLFVITEDEEGNSNLHILDHRKLFTDENPVIDEIKTITWVSDIAFLSNWNLILDKSDGTREVIITNLDLLDTDGKLSFRMKDTTLNVKKWENKSKKAVIDALWWWRISIETTEVSNEWNEDDKKIIEWIRSYSVMVNWISKTLKERFDDATSEEDIEMVRKMFLQITKKEEKLDLFHDLLKEIEIEINNKKQRIALNSIYSELDDILEELGGSLNCSILFVLKEKLKSIQRKRGNIKVWTKDKRVKDKDGELKSLIKTVDQKIKDYQESHKDEIVAKIDENLTKIKELLDWCDYALDVTEVTKTSLREATIEIIEWLDPVTKSEYKQKMDSLLNNRLDEIKEASMLQKEEEAQKINDIKNDIKRKIDMVKKVFSEITDIETLEDCWNSNALVIEINKKVKELPGKDADEILLSLRRTFEDIKYQLMISTVDSEWIVRSLDDFWIDTGLYYSEDWSEKVERKLSWHELPNWKIALSVELTNWETHKYDKSVYLKDFEKYNEVKIKWQKIKFELTAEEFDDFETIFSEYRSKWKKEIQKIKDERRHEKDHKKFVKLTQQLKEKEEHYKDARYVELLIKRLIELQKLNPRSLVPQRDPNYIVLDEEKEILKTLSARLKSQKKYWWIEILEWWPGLWKTTMCKFLASVTNREIIIVPCSGGDPETLCFSPNITGSGSVVYEPADWVKLMQKPWTLIVFDEIDKLHPLALAKLHSLFDRRRSVHHGHVWEVKANPDCIFMGTRNLYDTLPAPIASRSRILTMTYPSAVNEAYKISKYIDNPVFNMMKFEDFKALYEKYIERHEDEPKSAKEKQIYQEFLNIDKLLKVFTWLRSLFEEGVGYKYEVSYRDAQNIYIDYKNWTDLKTATMNFLLSWSWAVTEWDKSEKDEMIEKAKEIIDSIM